MPDEAQNKPLEKEKFAKFLRGAKEKVLTVPGSESRRCNEIWGWQYPPVGKMDIAERLEQTAEYLETHNFKDDPEFVAGLEECRGLIEYWLKDPLAHLYNSSYSKDSIYGFYYIDRKLYGILDRYNNGLITIGLQAEVKQAARRLNALKKRLDDADSSVEGVDAAIKRISEADQTAIQLPETLETLKNDANVVAQIKGEVQASGDVVSRVFKLAQEQEKYISDTKSDIEAILERSKSALASATSAGLAGAFYDRKKELQWIGLIWTLCLAAALGAAVFSIWWRADQLFALLDRANEIGTFILVANFVISIGFVGAPIWFAWLATKQVGYYFRLSEDYAFKASVSASYEGFMEEARRHDAEFEKKVLESTLERYDEPPLRFVDSRVHGSPYHELFESDEFKSAMKNIPGFKDRVLSALKGCMRASSKADSPVEEKPPVDSK